MTPQLWFWFMVVQTALLAAIVGALFVVCAWLGRILAAIDLPRHRIEGMSGLPLQVDERGVLLVHDVGPRG